MEDRRDDFPAEAVTALCQGDKLEAIKILRQSRHIDLKEAKEKVDQYLRNEPALQQKLATAQTENLGALGRYCWLSPSPLLCIT